jgi:YHS domain-containing protein
MMRQIGEKSLTMMAALLALALLPAPWSAQAASVVTTIVTDPLTGVAIEGYDPVTYFTDAEPQPGKADYEYYWGGVPWYFANAANRDVFMRAPEVYAPQHGGHCEMSLARGYLSDGKPRIYVVIGRKLYFFYSTANRDAFMLARAQATKDAEANWPKFEGDLNAD